jgi:hypothetical protein
MGSHGSLSQTKKKNEKIRHAHNWLVISFFKNIGVIGKANRNMNYWYL